MKVRALCSLPLVEMMNLLKFSVLHQDVTVTKRDDLEVMACLDDPAYLSEGSSVTEAKDPRFHVYSVYRGYSTLFCAASAI